MLRDDGSSKGANRKVDSTICGYGWERCRGRQWLRKECGAEDAVGRDERTRFRSGEVGALDGGPNPGLDANDALAGRADRRREAVQLAEKRRVVAGKKSETERQMEAGEIRTGRGE